MKSIEQRREEAWTKFAAAVLEGLVSRTGAWSDMDKAGMAKLAAEYADAMIAEWGKR